MRILVRAGKVPWQPISPESMLAGNLLATNSGNMLFSTSVFSALSRPGVDLSADGYQIERTPDPSSLAAVISERYDRLVIPLANAFRDDFRLDLWTSLIERLTIPVTVVGVGGQFAIDQDPPVASAAVDERTTAFVRAVLERGASIGVRGEITRRYLVGLGFGGDTVDVIGCPSLLRADLDVRMREPGPLSASSRIALYLTPGMPGHERENAALAALVDRTMAAYDDVVYVPQENIDLEFMLWGRRFTERRRTDLPRHEAHPLFAQDKARFYVDERTWREDLATADFAVGNRIHGAVAAILAGAPSVVLPFDSRIAELAEEHALPRAPMASITGEERLEDLADLIDTSVFQARHTENLARFASFLDRNGLPHTFDGSGTFTERMADVVLPPPVRPLTAHASPEVVSRLAWMRDSSPTHSGELHAVLPDWSAEHHKPDVWRSIDRLAERADAPGLSFEKRLVAALRRRVGAVLRRLGLRR